MAESSKKKYVKKYLLFRSLPYMIFFSCMAAVLILMASTNNNKYEFITAIVISTVVIITFFAVAFTNIYRFVSMIKRQEKNHGVVFSDKNSIELSKFSLWLILSDAWLIRPGIFAIYIGEIKSAAIGESYHEHRSGVIYPTKIKTKSGKVFRLKIKSEKNARLIRKWARRN